MDRSQREDDAIGHVETPLPERGAVFCAACWYFDQGAKIECTHENAVVRIRTWHGEETVSIPPSARNAHNDCRDFRQGTLARAIVREAGMVLRFLIRCVDIRIGTREPDAEKNPLALLMFFIRYVALVALLAAPFFGVVWLFL